MTAQCRCRPPRAGAAPILQGIEDIGAGHDDREGPQRVLDLHRSLVAGGGPREAMGAAVDEWLRREGQRLR